MGMGLTHPVLNVSAGGLCLRHWPADVVPGDIVSLSLVSDHLAATPVEVRCRVVVVEGALTHLAFVRVTMPLLTLLMEHIGKVLGVSPYYFGDASEPNG